MSRQFPPRSGITGFTREDGTFQCTGSRMGRPSDDPEKIVWSNVKPLRLKLRKVNLNSQGYDDGGAYWGTPGNLYQARGEDDESQLEFFARGPDKFTAFVPLLREIRKSFKCELR